MTDSGSPNTQNQGAVPTKGASRSGSSDGGSGTGNGNGTGNGSDAGNNSPTNSGKKKFFLSGFRVSLVRGDQDDSCDVPFVTFLAGLGFGTSILGLLILIFAGVIFGGEDDRFVLLRSAGIVLEVIGASAILLLVSVHQHYVARIFGYVVVAALIMVPADIIGLYLAVSNSDRKVEEFILQSTRSSSPTQVTEDAAILATVIGNHIRNHINGKKGSVYLANGEIDFEALTEGLNLRIEKALTEREEQRLLRRLAKFNALLTLQAYAEGKGEEVVFKYGREQFFISEMEYLRAESVITFFASEIDTARITALGCRIVNRNSESPNHEYEGCGRFDARQIQPTRALPNVGRTDEVRSSLRSVIENAALPNGVDTIEPPVQWRERIFYERRYIRFTIPAPALGDSEQLYLRTEALGSIDPRLALYDVTDVDMESPSFSLLDLPPIDVNDDIAEGILDSEVAWVHREQRTYVLELNLYSEGEGSTKLILSRQAFYIPVELERLPTAQDDINLDSNEGEITFTVRRSKFGGTLFYIDPVIYGQAENIFIYTRSENADPKIRLYQTSLSEIQPGVTEARDKFTLIAENDDISSDNYNSLLRVSPETNYYYWLEVENLENSSDSIEVVISKTGLR